MTSRAAPKRHRMIVRRSMSFMGNHRTFTCCEDTDTPFTVTWNTSTTSHARFPVLGTPSEVIDRIINHVTRHRDDPQTIAAAETVRTMVGLSDDVTDGLKMLRQQLDYVTLKFRNV